MNIQTQINLLTKELSDETKNPDKDSKKIAKLNFEIKKLRQLKNKKLKP